MNWLSRVRNALPFMAKRETEGNLWNKCPSCAQMIFIKEYEENLSVCTVCGHHGRIGPKARCPANPISALGSAICTSPNIA